MKNKKQTQLFDADFWLREIKSFLESEIKKSRQKVYKVEKTISITELLNRRQEFLNK